MAEVPTGIADEDRVKARSSSFWRVLKVILTWCAIGGALWWWKGRQEPPAPIAPAHLTNVKGVRLLYRHECGRCHTVALPGMHGNLGPPLRGLAQRHDRAYLEQSLRDPGRVVVKGYINVMPSYAGLSASEERELVDYLLTL